METSGPDFEAMRVEADKWRATLRNLLPTSRESYRESHIPILQKIKDYGSVSMNRIASELERRPNFIHVRLQNLIKAGLAAREKRPGNIGPSGRASKEFFYSLVNLDEQDSSQIQSDQISPSTTQKTTQGESNPMSGKFTQQHQEREAPSVSMLPGLPEYDPKWSEETKAEWMRLYRQLLEISREMD